MARFLAFFTRERMLGTLVLLMVLLSAVALRHWWGHREASSSSFAPSADELVAVERFEAERRADSLQQQLDYERRRAAWAAEKAARQAARQQREAAYEAQRQLWAQEKAGRAALRAEREAYWDSVRALRPKKLAKGEVVALNSADTLALQRIPGIGPALARTIVAYRERLGGFLRVEQLRDIEHLPADIERWVQLDVTTVRPLYINKATFKELVRHPYLNYEQVKVIVNRRQKYGPLRSWKDLGASTEFSVLDFERLTPYVRF